MNFVTSVFKKYIKNETNQENERVCKLVAEPAGQKPRRSVLKEFDPFAPDSPCPPQKQKNPTILDEEEIFEDAETSLTSYLCPRTKNSNNSLKTPSKVFQVIRESMLIPDLTDNPTEEPLSLNETADLSYREAVENLSQTDVAVHDKTSSEEDFEFNTKRHPRLSETIQNSEDNMMVDSLEQTFDADSISTVESVQPSVFQIEPHLASDLKANSIDVGKEISNPVSQNTGTKNDQDHFNGGLLDSLEKQIVPNEDILTDSLEILRQDESLKEVSNQKNQEENVSSLSEIGLKCDTTVKTLVQNNSEANQPIILSTDPTKRGDDLPSSDETDQEVKNDTPKLDLTFEAPKENTEPNKIPQNLVESQTDELSSDHLNAAVTISETSKLDATFEAPSPDEVESLTTPPQNDHSNTTLDSSETLKLDPAFEAPKQITEFTEIPQVSSPHVLESLTSQIQSDQSNAPVENQDTLKLNTTFEAAKQNIQFTEVPQAPSPNVAESSIAQTQSDQSDAIVENAETLKSNTTFEAPKENIEFTEIPQASSPDVVESLTFQTQSDQSNAPVENQDSSKLNTTFEATKQNIEFTEVPQAPSPNIAVPSTAQTQSENAETLKPNTTFEASKQNIEITEVPQAPSPDVVGFPTSQTRNGQSNTTSENLAILKCDTTFESPKQDMELTKTPQAPSLDVVESQTAELQNDQSNVAIKDLKTPRLDTTLEMLPKQEDTLVVQTSVNSTESDSIMVISSVELNKQSETLPKSEQTINGLNVTKLETTVEVSEQDENIIEKSLNRTTHDAKLNQTFDGGADNPVLHENSNQNKDIGINNKPDIKKPQTLTNSSEFSNHNKSLSLRDIIDTSLKDVVQSLNTEENNSKDVNSTFITEEQTAESCREMEVLAQSLNRTIDVEESAIEDINSSESTNTSGELSKESLNVTIERVKSDLSNHESVTENKEALKGEEKTEAQRRKMLERQETEEFEDLERQYEEKKQISETGVKKPNNSQDDTVKRGVMDTVIDQDYSRVFQRQDTQEFEALERECKESVSNLNSCDVKEDNTYKSETERNVEIKIENTKQERTSTGEQELQKNKDLALDFIAAGDSEVKQEKTKSQENMEQRVNNQSDLALKPEIGHVKVKVSGNICNANTTYEDSDQVDAQKPDKQAVSEINLKCDTLKEQDKAKNTNSSSKTFNKPSGTAMAATMNGSHEKSPQKSDEVVPETGKNVTKLNSRPECRPNIRSVRNKTQVINKPVFENETDKGSNKVDDANKQIEEELHQYKSKSDELKNQVDRLQSDIETLKKENMRKDKYILSSALEKENERNMILKFKKILEEYEKTMAEQNKELVRLKEESERNAKHFTSSEMAFADVFEKYEKTKTVIEAYRRNEEILQQNIQRAEEQLTKIEAKFSVMKEQYTEQIRKATNDMMQEKEKYRQDIAKLQAMVKRLEIKASSLETSLKQKTEECQALAALCDDITGKPM